MDRDRSAGLPVTGKLEVTLLLAVVAEVLIGRVLTRGLEQKPVFVKGVAQTVVPPTWFAVLEYVAVFLLYFAALLGVIVLATRAAELARGFARRGSVGDQIDRAAGAASLGALALAAVFAAVVEPGPAQVALHASLWLVAVHQVVRVWLRLDDLGAAIGLTLTALPILLYCTASLFSDRLWNEDQMAGGQARALLDRWGRAALAIAAIASPYCLAPRPFARAMTRIAPFAVAMIVAGIGAVLLRVRYVATVKAVNRVFGLDLRSDVAQDQIALYLLAFSTIVWTVIACLSAPSPARRQIGLGLALIVLAGWSFAWPLTFVVIGAGLVLIGDAAPRVRSEEQPGFAPATPPIDDDTWQGYVGHVVSALRRLVGAEHHVSAVSVRGEGDQTSTVIVTERRGVPVKIRVERFARSVVVVDVVCGREIDPSRAATWTMVARAGGVLGGGGHPEPPPAGSLIKADDPVFDDRFRCRGDRGALVRLLDDGLRARAAASLDGWIAYWEGQSLRYRVFPGQGAPLDHPVPLSALAFDGRPTEVVAERMIAVVELCVDIAGRGLPATDEPTALAGEIADEVS